MIVEEMQRSFGAVLPGVLVVLLGAVLRAPGLFTEFWLDEIRGLSNVAGIDSAAQVVTGIHHDSNHWLMSLWMYAIGPRAPFWAYRLPSFLAGVAAVVCAGWLAEVARSKPGPVMLLTATSFPLAFYSSEARGYALAALAGLALLPCLVRWAETRELRFLAGSSLASSVGLLSHLSFVLVLGAALVYNLVLVGRGRLPLRHALAVHVVPAALFAVLVAVDLQHLGIGGGTHEPPGTILSQTASLAIGGPIEGAGVLLFAAVAVVLLGAELARRLFDYWPNRTSTEARSYLWVFFGAAILLPIWVALVFDPPFLFPRYFLVLLAFAPLLVAGLAKELERPWFMLLVAAWLAVNCHAVWRFTEEGRGSYEEALRFLIQSSDREVVAVGSDHDLRNERIVGFYRDRMGEEGRRLRYVSGEAKAEFWIGSYEGSQCEGCELLRAYPSSSLSGAQWRLYRKR